MSSEFRSYRLKLANQLGSLKGAPYEVKVQEDFEQGGFTLLDALADYVRECDLVIHLVGEACGARPSAEHVRTMFEHLSVAAPEPLPERSYTQWEFDLAVMFGRKTLCFFAAPDARRDCALPVAQSEDEARMQREHRERIERSGKHRETFSGHTDLVNRVFYDLGLQAELKVNNLPYKSLGSLFKGREEFLAQLRETLGSAEHRGHQRVAAITATATAATVHGLGGIGKTRAALEYAHKYADEYTALLFVVADSPANLQSNLAALCGANVLDLAEKDARETEVQVAAALAWLQGHPGWFLILDNVDSDEAEAAVQALLGRLTKAGQVVITSRLSQWGGGVEALALDVLAVEDASAFLLERTDGRRRKQDDDAVQARTLAVELGQLALALEQAGAYIALYRSTFAGYLEEWRANRLRVIEWFNERTMQYPRSVAVTWQTSFDRLGEPARHLLRLLSWLAPDPVPESLLAAGVGPFAAAPTEEVSAGKASSFLKRVFGKLRAPKERPFSESPAALWDARGALAELTEHSLARQSSDAETFSVHRLVQDVTRRTLPEGTRLSSVKEALRWVDAAFQGEPVDVRTWGVLDPLVPHALAVAGFADQQEVPEPTARLMNSVGLLLKTKARHSEAEPLYRRVVAIFEKAYGRDHPNVAASLNNLAQLLQATNRLGEAEPLMRRALGIDEASYGPDHPEVATDLNNLAQLLQATNRLAEAEPLMRRALGIDEASYGRDHPKVATRLNNLAQLLQATNRLGEAEPLMRRALGIDEASYGPDHPNVAIRLNNLAQLLQATNRLAEAEPLMRRVVAILEKAYGPDHPNVATSLINLAGLLQATNRLAEAEPLMRRALGIDEASYGLDHPEVATDLNNLAQLLQATNRLAEAEPLMRRALGIDEASYGPDHPNVAIRLSNLAALLQATNRLAEAEPLMRRMVAILVQFTRATGHPHPHLQAAVNNYASLLEEMGRSRDEILAALREIAPEFF